VGWSVERVAREAGIPVLLQPSVKRGLDTEWSDPDAKACALNTLVQQVDSLNAWLRSNLPEGLRKRVAVEHSLAHLSRRQGRRARYRGTRKNLFDVRRAAAVQNLETIDLRRLRDYYDFNPFGVLGDWC
jgi:hypothetical protein